MSFRFHNSLSRELEDFHPRQENKVGIYSCGPTVYDLAHIGNFRSYIFADLLGRALRLGGFEIQHAVNITDVDDKTIQATVRQNEKAALADLAAHTRPFVDAFFEDLETLGIGPFNNYPRATENIEGMIDLVGRLVESGLAYEQDGSIYYSIGKDDNYGKLSRIDLSEVKTGLRYNTDEYTKEDIRDFVLWKAEKPEEKLAWDSPYGRGRPGWHLECSAMIRDTFSGPIDIHTGGVDLIFPHHENEIAQSTHGYGAEFVTYWLHCEHLLVEGKKMSKSLGNFFTLRDLLDKGYHPAAIRYLLLSVHYRQKLNFTLQGLDQISHALKRAWTTYTRLEAAAHGDANVDDDAIVAELEAQNHSFLEALQDDLNSAKAFAVFHKSLSWINSLLDENNEQLPAVVQKHLLGHLDHFDQVLNIFRFRHEVEAGDDIPASLRDLVEQRTAARQRKDFAEADRLRDAIHDAGYEVLDGADGSRLQKL